MKLSIWWPTYGNTIIMGGATCFPYPAPPSRVNSLLNAPREAVQLPKCPKYNAGCSVSLLRVQKRLEISQWLWLPPTPPQKVDSGVGLLSCLPLIQSTPNSIILVVYALLHVKFVLISEHQIGHRSVFHEIQNVLKSVKSHTFISGWKFMPFLNFARIGSEVFFEDSTHWS